MQAPSHPAEDPMSASGASNNKITVIEPEPMPSPAWTPVNRAVHSYDNNTHDKNVPSIASGSASQRQGGQEPESQMVQSRETPDGQHPEQMLDQSSNVTRGLLVPDPRTAAHDQQSQAASASRCHPQGHQLQHTRPPNPATGVPLPSQARPPQPLPGSICPHTRGASVIPLLRGQFPPGEVQDYFFRLITLHMIQNNISPPRSGSRGPLVVIEGDNFSIVRSLGVYLHQELKKETELSVKLIDGLQTTFRGTHVPLRPGRLGLSEYHRVVAAWLEKSNVIEQYLQTGADAVFDLHTVATKPAKSNPSGSTAKRVMAIENLSLPNATPQKPVCMISNYCLKFVDYFARNIALPQGEAYIRDVRDHWVNMATYLRGVLAPDLTIFVHDCSQRPGLTFHSRVDGVKFILHRAPVPFTDGANIETDIDPALLRRVKFEVTEYIREFGSVHTPPRV